MKVEELKKGEFFRRNEKQNVVYVRGEYDRATKKYSCHRFDDNCAEIFLKGDKEVFVDFEF